ncbi:MAG TPA: efflux transporter outer membrane subunit [Phenylobacterium sp.]|nr:efflux transporter outer membrane subunit [Phenylobacterium sp.]
MGSVKTLLTLTSALALSACAAVGPDFKRPAAPAAAGYAMAGDTRPGLAELAPEARPAGPWWTALGSPDLDATIRQALKDNPTVAEAAATLERAQAQTDAARGGLAPQAQLAAGGLRERINTQAFGFTGFPSPTLSLYSIGSTVSYDLDLFGGRKRALEAAGAQAETEARRADAAYLALTGNVALQALRIASLKAQLDTLDLIIADDRRTIDMVQRAEAAGGAAPSAISGGQGQLARDEAQRPALERDLAQARHQLALLVGRSPADWTAPDFNLASFKPPAQVPVAVPSALVRQRPDILAAEAQLHAATARIGVATADLYPNIRLTAGLTQQAIDPANLFRYDSTGWNLGAGLTAPLLNGGTLKANRRAAEAEARAALARYQGTVLRALVQVADVLTALAEDDRAIAALTRSEDSQAANLKDARKAYELGGGALIAVVDAQRELNRARRETIVAQGRRYSDLVDLFTATAANWTPDAS